MRTPSYYSILLVQKGVTHWTRVDAEDFDRLLGLPWHLTSTGYVVRDLPRAEGNGRGLLMHRAIMGLGAASDGLVVDHINRDRLDNRRENLRIVTHAENCRNVPSQAGSSKYRGVGRVTRANRWAARATFERRQFHIGSFMLEVDAARAVNAFWVERGYAAPNDV